MAPQKLQTIAFQDLVYSGIEQNLVDVYISATLAPCPHREHEPATGLLRRTVLF